MHLRDGCSHWWQSEYKSYMYTLLCLCYLLTIKFTILSKNKIQFDNFCQVLVIASGLVNGQAFSEVSTVLTKQNHYVFSTLMNTEWRDNERVMYVINTKIRKKSKYKCKKLSSLKHCVRSQIIRLKLQKSFCDLEHGLLLWI